MSGWNQCITKLVTKLHPLGSLTKGFVMFQHRYCIGPSSELRELILKEYHDSRIGGHAGFYRTLYRVRQQFHWKGMTRFVKDFVSGCLIWQQVKLPPTKPLGLLQPLEIPTAIWEEISLDFVTGLPLVKGQSVIIVVVDRLSKYCHLGALPANYSANTVADFFAKQIIRLHGVPTKIIFDRDKIFLSRFWKEIFAQSGTTLRMSSTTPKRMVRPRLQTRPSRSI